MATVTCTRCGNTADGLDNSPLPGDIGARVLAQTCGACWQEWLGMQVQVINEYKLSPAEPEHYEFLVAQMGSFLNLREDS